MTKTMLVTIAAAVVMLSGCVAESSEVPDEPNGEADEAQQDPQTPPVLETNDDVKPLKTRHD